MEDLLIENKQDCCGCAACYNICPKQAIIMVEDEEGFLYPEIKKEKCINCGLCEILCPVKNSKEQKSILETYAAYNLDETARYESSSGGVFSALSENILQYNGIIYGAAFNSKFEVEHIRIEKLDELEKLRGSKYVQSSINETYKTCKQDLDAERKVLFSGTPCQIAGLKNYLRKDYDNLVCVDIICHGVPSRKVWRNYLQYRFNFAKSKIEQIAFRLKNEGWKQYAVKFAYANQTAYCQNLHNDIYMRGFLQDLYLRPSCYNCHFKKKDRDSDITLADFWGIENIYPEIDDDKGMSLLIIHTEKGKNCIESIKEKLFLKEANFDEAIKYNSSMIKSVAYNPKREKFFKEKINEQNIVSVIEKYTKPKLKQSVKKKLKAVLETLHLFGLAKDVKHAIKG